MGILTIMVSPVLYEISWRPDVMFRKLACNFYVVQICGTVPNGRLVFTGVSSDGLSFLLDELGFNSTPTKTLRRFQSAGRGGQALERDSSELLPLRSADKRGIVNFFCHFCLYTADDLINLLPLAVFPSVIFTNRVNCCLPSSSVPSICWLLGWSVQKAFGNGT